MTMNGSEVEIKVSPEALDQKAEEVTKAVLQMEKLFQTVLATVEKTQHYWIGEAGNAHRTAFLSHKDDIEEMLTRLKEHPADLQKIANTYRTTEHSLTEAISQLPSNLID